MNYSKKSLLKLKEEFNIDIKQKKEDIINYIKENTKNGENLVIGISGGKDSTVAFKLAVEAVGRDRVYPVFMPFYEKGNYMIDSIKYDENFLQDIINFCNKYGIELVVDKTGLGLKVDIKGQPSIFLEKDTYIVITEVCPIFNVEESYLENYLPIEKALAPFNSKDNIFYLDFIGLQNALVIPVKNEIISDILYGSCLYNALHNRSYDKFIYPKDLLCKKHSVLDKNAKDILDIERKYSLDLSKNADRNLLARLRMNILYYVAQNIPHGRVLNTSNYSEKILGYSTKWGDNVGDIFVLDELTCHEVGLLGLELGIPEEYIIIPPSDGMAGASDEEILGVSYYELDKTILKVKNSPIDIDGVPLSLEKNSDVEYLLFPFIQKNVLKALGKEDRLKEISHKYFYMNKK